MKKIKMRLIAAGILSVFALSACAQTGETSTSAASTTAAPMIAETADSPGITEEVSEMAEGVGLQDGTYSITYDKVDTHGWRTFMTMEVESGQITEVVYDYYNEEGGLKTVSDEYTQNDAARPVIEAFPVLVEQLIDTQDPGQVDAVTGATVSSGIFKDFAARLIDAAKEGNTEEIVIPQTDTQAEAAPESSELSAETELTTQTEAAPESSEPSAETEPTTQEETHVNTASQNAIGSMSPAHMSACWGCGLTFRRSLILMERRPLMHTTSG